MPKKSFYVFLTSLLGMLLFLVLDRVIVFFFLFMIAGGYISPQFNYLQFIITDYFTLILAILLGSWYGIWLGLYWFSKVYEEKSHSGFIAHTINTYWPTKKQKQLETKFVAVEQKLEKDIWEFENLAHKTLSEIEAIPAPKKPAKKRVVRKPKTVKTI